MFALGVPTLIDQPDIHSAASLCHDLGLSFVELNMNMPPFCPEHLSPTTVREVAERWHIGFTLHLPEELDLASPHPQIRRGHVERCLQTLEWANECGIGLANLHLNPGIYFTLPDRKVWVYERFSDQFVERLAESFGVLYEAASRAGVALTIENTGDFSRPHIARAIDVLASLDGFALAWDTGHDASVDYSDTPTLGRLSDRVRHMHLHDYDGITNHQVLLTGEVDVHGALSFAERKDIGVVIEVKTPDALRESVVAIREWLRPR